MAVHDPYKALGVPHGATKAEIKAAHRKLAKRHHPDKAQTDGRKFLEVQEAYRVLSDPLLRREWDEKHAPGPVRAREQAKPPARKPPTTRKEPRRRASTARTTTARPDEPAPQPRSSRAYTWSAADVPWWEEGIKRAEARSARSRSAKSEAAKSEAASSAQSEPPPTAAPDFEVYNRSSGAAWSMAARKYFRKGDADLPSRGVFRHEGGMPVTAGRARAAARAEAEARRKAENANGRDRGGEVRPPRKASDT